MIKLYRVLLSSLFCLAFQFMYAQPANDNCASATNLTVNGALTCAQSLDNATVQAGECQNGYAGGSAESVWYRFTATNSSMVLDYLETTGGTFASTVRVYGPYGAGAGCVPGCAAAIYNSIQTGDPGHYISLTGLSTTGNNQYLIQIEDGDPNGPGLSGRRFCIGIYTVSSNNTVNTPSVVASCGVAYNGSTVGGYTPSGTGVGFRNLDNNGATTCPACGAQPGADIPFVINNDSWFSFCTVNAGTWQIDFSVGTCVFSGVNSGAQMALFTGSPTALTWHSQAANPTYSGGSWTSPTITLAAGECAYMVVDGFAGDACAYSYTLTNLTGGCIVLPIELLSFDAVKKGKSIETKWTTATESNNDYFTVEKSKDGITWEIVGVVDGAGNSNSTLNYTKIDANPYKGTSYYRLKQTDYDGKYTYSAMKFLHFEDDSDLSFEIVPNPVAEDGSFLLNFNHISDADYTIAIMDLTGKMVYSKNIQITDTKVEVNELLAKGMYVLQLRNADYLFTKKLIIK